MYNCRLKTAKLYMAWAESFISVVLRAAYSVKNFDLDFVLGISSLGSALYFPKVQERMMATAVLNKALRVLAVDDDEDALANMRDLLEQLGYEVTTADSGESAIECCKENSFDVALLDFKMPRLSGLDVASFLQACQPGVVSILVTAFSPSQLFEERLVDSPQETQPRLIDQILSKPLDVRKLIDTLNRVRDQRSILVVDDDRDLCRNLEEILTDAKWRVVTVQGISDAVEVLKQRSMDVALVDLKLPEGSGLDLIATIRQQWPDTNSIVMTGFREELVTAIANNNANVDDICYKPLDVPDILACVAKNASSRLNE